MSAWAVRDDSLRELGTKYIEEINRDGNSQRARDDLQQGVALGQDDRGYQTKKNDGRANWILPLTDTKDFSCNASCRFVSLAFGRLNTKRSR